MKNMKKIIFISLVLTISSTILTAQTKEKGPWWPHPIWGEGDQAGGSNWITSAKIIKSLQLVKTGKLYELGHVYQPEMPLFGKRIYEMRSPGTPSGGPFGKKKTERLLYK